MIKPILFLDYLTKAYAKKFGFGEIKPMVGNKKRLIQNSQFISLRNNVKLDINSMKFEFDDSELVIDFSRVKADTISLFSGGVDSFVATKIYADANRDKRIVLITFDDAYSPNAEYSHLAANILLKKCGNIADHFIVSIPYVLSRRFIYEDLEKDYERCSYLRMNYCIYLLKKYFGGEIIIDGGEADETRESIEMIESFLNGYGIKKESYKKI